MTFIPISLASQQIIQNDQPESQSGNVCSSFYFLGPNIFLGTSFSVIPNLYPSVRVRDQLLLLLLLLWLLLLLLLLLHTKQVLHM